MKKFFILYFDILGYQKKASANSLDLFNTINLCIEKIKYVIENNKIMYPTSDVKLKVFSDNFFLCSENDYQQLIFIASNLQADLLSDDVFIRGALLYGDLIYTDDFIYGKGIIDAHDIESNIAIFPRIIIDDSYFIGAIAIENSKSEEPRNIDEIRNVIKQSFCYNLDDTLFLNYLEELKLLTESIPQYAYPYTLNEFLIIHKERIIQNLKTDNRKVRHKYLWCKNYHNNFCKKYGFDALLIE